MGLEAKKCQHYLPNCRYRTNQPHRFQANLRNLIEIAAEYQATCPSCMHRKSAGKKIMIHAVAIESLYCKQPMRPAMYIFSKRCRYGILQPPASGRARRIFTPVHHLTSSSWRHTSLAKGPRVWLRIHEKHDPKSY